MRVVIIANQKGGAGKTTLCRHLAVAAGENVAIIDRDPQGSLTAWWNRRVAETPILVEVKESMEEVLLKLRASGIKTVFIDTPPSVSPWMGDLMALADLVLVPVQPTPDDLDAIAPTLSLIEKSGKPFFFVVSRAKTQTRLVQEAIAALAAHGRVAPAVIYDRVAYPTSGITGQTVTELTTNSATCEVAQLMEYVDKQLSKAPTNG